MFSHSLQWQQAWSQAQSTYMGRVEMGGGVYTKISYVMVDILKGGGRATPPSPGWADFSTMLESIYARKWPLPLYLYSVE